MDFAGKNKNTLDSSKVGKSSIDVFIIGLVIIIALILTGLSVCLLWSLEINIETLKKDFKVINEIDRFQVDFYRILAMLRDVASGLY